MTSGPEGHSLVAPAPCPPLLLRTGRPGPQYRHDFTAGGVLLDQPTGGGGLAYRKANVYVKLF